MPYTVLIVQDRQPHRHMPADAATLCGLDILGQTVGVAQTVAALAEQAADILLLDLTLAMEDNLSLLAKLHQQWPDALLAVCAPFDATSELSRAFAAGAHRCLRKPYRLDELKHLFETLVCELDQAVANRR
jgi:CheY-like chemotaxis protein